MEVREPGAKYFQSLVAKETSDQGSPSGWHSVSVDRLTTTVASGKSRSDTTGGDWPVFGSTGVIGSSPQPEYEGQAILVARVGANAGSLQVASGRYGVTDNTIIIRVNASASWRFVWRQLQAANLNSMVFGSGQPLITGSQIKALELALPVDHRDQERIADVLDDADTLIDSLEQLLTKQRQIKQGAMQELLTGKRRLPGFNHQWQESRLGALGTFLKGAGIRRDQAMSGSLPCVRYGELYTAHEDHVRAFHSWISPEVAAEATRLRQGDLLFACSGETKEEIGKCVAFLDDCEAYAGGDIVILRPTEGVSSAFMGYALNSPPVVRQKASRGQGDAVVHISSTALSSVTLPVPSVAEQHAIAQVLTDMDTSLTALQARLTKARQLKQALMQVLLTGRIRLLPPGAAVAGASPA